MNLLLQQLQKDNRCCERIWKGKLQEKKSDFREGNHEYYKK